MSKLDQLSYESALAEGLSVRATARLLNIPISTAYRRLTKLKRVGNLLHGNVGNKHHQKYTNKEKVLELCRDKYADFGVLHICELLEVREGIKIGRETLRKLLGRPRERRRPKQRQRRERRPCFGDLLQIDGSFEKWFNGEKSCLMNIVDDATNVSELHFEKEETINSACYCAWEWFKKYGVPHAFYADGRNMYHILPEREHNFFTSMCAHLGIKVIMARSPQAKGRVERLNGIHQKRLIPLMKLDGVRDMKSANQYLKKYIVEHNKHFSFPPTEGDSHRPLSPKIKSIDDVCYIIVHRKLNNDWTFSYEGRSYQFPRQSSYPPAHQTLDLKITISGKITAFYRSSKGVPI